MERNGTRTDNQSFAKVTDHKWSLIYIGAAREYRLTEYKRVSGEWVKLSDSTWSTLDSALLHIGDSTERRLKETQL